MSHTFTHSQFLLTEASRREDNVSVILERGSLTHFVSQYSCRAIGITHGTVRHRYHTWTCEEQLSVAESKSHYYDYYQDHCQMWVCIFVVFAVSYK